MSKKFIYLCGPTVYDKPHIGNLRPILTFDIFNRANKFNGNDISFIHNITDIDDKIIAKSIEKNISEEEISNKYTSEYLELLRNYNIELPEHMPKVTESMDVIIEFISGLIEKKAAYISNGNVYFDVTSDKKYGTISNRKLEEMKFDNEVNDKKHPADFALWKTTKQGITFNSPWGEGRPGWHTECAAFINNIAKDKLYIHGGGSDLLFPHHENEAAQFRVLHNKEIADNWKHIGQLSIDNKKMSKSLGNIIYAETFADDLDPDVLRMIFLSVSITGPVDFTDDIVSQATNKVNSFRKVFNKAQLSNGEEVDIKNIVDAIIKFDFSLANKLINEEVKNFNKEEKNSSNIIQIMKILGFNFSKRELTSEEKEIYKEWEKLKENKKYDKSDFLRDKLINLGII